MTSKEALEKLCSRCCVESECYTSCEYKELLEKDLERKEVLEEIHKDDTKQIKELQRQLNIYKVNYYRLDDAVIELINKFKLIKGSDKNE